MNSRFRLSIISTFLLLTGCEASRLAHVQRVLEAELRKQMAAYSESPQGKAEQARRATEQSSLEKAEQARRTAEQTRLDELARQAAAQARKADEEEKRSRIGQKYGF